MKGGEIIAVLDAGPLIHLDEIESLRLVEGFREVLLPEIVEREALLHRPNLRLDSIPGLVRIARQSAIPESLLVMAREFGLHEGELAAITALREHHGDCLLSDDAAARAMAEAIGFQVRGTVGLILRGWLRKQITKTEAREMLRALPLKSSLHLRAGFLEKVFAEFGD
jgi:predicted nucleic acid-binding protein